MTWDSRGDFINPSAREPSLTKNASYDWVRLQLGGGGEEFCLELEEEFEVTWLC
jgi:hypothetical protein